LKVSYAVQASSDGAEQVSYIGEEFSAGEAIGQVFGGNIFYGIDL